MRFALMVAALMSMLATSTWAQQPAGAYLDGGTSTVGVILVHGRYRGLGSAESEVVNPLRIALHERLGVHTLSLDYPQTAGSRNAQDEVTNFPAAHQRIAQAISFLTHERGVTQIYLVGHSLGTRITISYLATNSVPSLRGYIGIGIYGGGCDGDTFDPLASLCNLKTIRRKDPNLPILDVVAMSNPKDVRFADERQKLVSPTYQQVRIRGADHNFRRKQDDMLDVVTAWVKAQSELPRK